MPVPTLPVRLVPVAVDWMLLEAFSHCLQNRLCPDLFIAIYLSRPLQIPLSPGRLPEQAVPREDILFSPSNPPLCCLLARSTEYSGSHKLAPAYGNFQLPSKLKGTNEGSASVEP